MEKRVDVTGHIIVTLEELDIEQVVGVGGEVIARCDEVDAADKVHEARTVEANSGGEGEAACFIGVEQTDVWFGEPRGADGLDGDIPADSGDLELAWEEGGEPLVQCAALVVP